MRLNHDRGIDLYAIGVYPVDQGATWQTLTSASFEDQTSDAVLAASLRLVELSVRNTHATQILYVRLDDADVAVSKAMAIPAGGTMNLDGLLLAKLGAVITDLEVRGSGANTTGQLIAGWADTDSN